MSCRHISSLFFSFVMFYICIGFAADFAHWDIHEQTKECVSVLLHCIYSIFLEYSAGYTLSLFFIEWYLEH